MLPRVARLAGRRFAARPSAGQMASELLRVEEPDAAPLLLDRLFVSQIVKGARDRLPAECERGRDLLLREVDYRFVELVQFVQEEVADLLEGGFAGQLVQPLVGAIERVGEQAEPAEGDLGKELLERTDCVESETQ